jgi:hypothetical protein
MLSLRSLRRAIGDQFQADWPMPWLWSMLVHMVFLLATALMIGSVPVRHGGISLNAEFSTSLDNQGRYEDAGGGQEAAFTAERTKSSEDSTQGGGSEALAALLDEQPPVNPNGVLPSAKGPLGPEGLETGGVASAAHATEGPGGRGGVPEGKVRTSIFGVVGEGSRFVYVFDRSGSTGGPGWDTLSAAKAQLIASLSDLDKVHQFQVVFYNQNPVVFNPTGGPARLVFATEQNKRLARKFIGSITSDGGTNHLDALREAIRMQPDAIFFFTDADEPRLTSHQLEQIHRLANGISINAIEFGVGPQADSDDFMVRLARQNEGQFGYVDVTKLGPVARQ